jgi:hypothetical protein
MSLHEEMVEGLKTLNNNVIKALNIITRDLHENVAQDKCPDKRKEYATTLTKISKALPKIAHTISQLKLMQDEIDEKRKREEKKEKYSKADLLIAQRHIAKLLEEYETKEESCES